MNAATTQTARTADTPAAADAADPGDSPDQPPSSADSADADIPPEQAATIDIVDDRAPMAEPAVDATRLASLLRHAVRQVDRSVARVSVRLLDAARMSALHHRALGDPAVTDVLSFDATNPGRLSPVEADIAVCVDVAARQAARRGHDLERELLLYALHGVLHCCGHDDHDDAAYQRMHREEDRILAAIGVGPTFADHGDSIDGD